jgi:hypothetical protein
MKKVFLFLILSLVCALAGFSLAWAMNNRVFTRWQTLGAPPGGAVDILDADESFVYAMTSQNEVYRWLTTWEKAQPLEHPLLDPNRVCEPLTPRLPSPPGKVIDRIEGTQCYADGAAYFHYVLLEDGSVWEWGFVTSPLMLSLYLFLSLAGCVVGAVLAGFLAILIQILGSTRSRDRDRTL